MKEQQLESLSTYDKLFYDNLYLVDILIKKFKYSYLDRDDLRQAGLMGLFQATLHFDESKNIKFNTFATYYVIGAIKKEIRDNRLIKLSDKFNKIKGLSYNNYTIDDIQSCTGYSREIINEAIASSDRIEKYDDINVISDKEESFYIKLKEKIEELNKEKRFKKIAFIMYLYYFEKITQKEIGERLNLGQSQISRLLNLGKKIIK